MQPNCLCDFLWRIGCDALKASCRKFLRGPRGTAILYIREDFLPKLDPVYLDVLPAPLDDGMPAVGTDARKFETSERSIALLPGLRTRRIVFIN
ncbi:aminotransferase class V-fold PLP-dependent enzyme [Phyllobacterium sp. SB3]|uniref:aminotransferase class V-fold PLP-dependent enzyme n=1 Tax=Phyllobacterium sp. SB3 TaxID=3156073 RepID=UPI0032AFF026